MSQDLVISSTTDDEAAMNIALAHGTELASDDTSFGLVDRATGEPVDDTPPVVPAVVKPPEVRVEAKSKEKPKREDFANDDDFDRAQLGHKAQKRIDKLTWEKGEETRRADKLQAELTALRPVDPVRTAPVPVPAAPEVDELTKTLETAQAALAAVDKKLAAIGKAPKLEDQESIEKWEEKSVAWQEQKADLREERATVKARIETLAILAEDRKADTAALAAEERQIQIDAFMGHRADAKARIADFETVIKANEDMAMSPTMQYVVITSPVGHDIAYYLATHRDEATELNSLGDTPEALRMIGGIEWEVRRGRQTPVAAVAEVPEPEAPGVITQTPEPIAPVGGRSTASTQTIDQIADQREFVALRNRQEFERRRRR